jgi:signal transduction histidine kinase
MALGIVYTNDAGLPFVVIVESFFDRVYMENLTQILSFVFLVSIAIVALGGWIFSRQALAPVSRIMNQVDALLPTDMSQRLKPNNQYDELSRLVITFNKLLDRIQQVFKVQKMFVSNVSHELKNPLNIIVSQVEVALDKERSPEEYKSTLESILVDVKELNETGDRLMQLARINAEEANIRFKPLRIDEVIWELKEQLIVNHPDYKINFEVGNLPENEAELFVHGNEHLLKTALVNLIDNGCKYSPDKKVRVKLTFSPEGDTIVEVSDNGPGIPEEEISMIFNAFYRSASTSSVRGSGIGLSLVESIIKLHNISLEIRSKVGEGTSFILKFPENPPVT